MHAHTLNHPTCFQGYETRRALDKFDMESSTPFKVVYPLALAQVLSAELYSDHLVIHAVKKSSLRLCGVNPFCCRRVRVETPVRSHLGVHAETSISDSTNITGQSVPLTYELFIGSKKVALRK